MYTTESRCRPCLVLLFREGLCSRFIIFIIVALILLNTHSSGRLIPSPQAFQKPSSPSNTSLLSNAPKVYVIYSFVEGPSQDSENERIRLHLGMLLGPADVQEYGGDYTGVEFWRVKMNDMQRTAFKSANPLAQIHENTQLLYHEDLQLSQNHNQNVSDPHQFLPELSNGTTVRPDLGAATIYQVDAPSDLKVVSWAPDVSFGRTRSYAYDPENGGEAIIYVIENGIDGRNSEFAWPPQEWLYAPSVRRTETDDNPISHGSCVASKATGARNGVSKTTRLVVVKSSLSLVDIAWAFQQIVNTVSKLKTPRVVVLLAATTKLPWRSELIQDARWSRLYLRMENLISLGAVIVVPSGSYGERSLLVDTVPAVFASPSRFPGRPSLPLIVVGTVDNNGAEASWSQRYPLNSAAMLWAPGIRVACTKRGWNIRPTESGTSFSAGMVAGLAAYFLGMKSPPFAVGGQVTSGNLMDYFQNSASWVRRPGGRKVIWNGQDGSLVQISNASILPLTTTNVSTY